MEGLPETLLKLSYCPVRALLAELSDHACPAAAPGLPCAEAEPSPLPPWPEGLVLSAPQEPDPASLPLPDEDVPPLPLPDLDPLFESPAPPDVRVLSAPQEPLSALLPVAPPDEAPLPLPGLPSTLPAPADVRVLSWPHEPSDEEPDLVPPEVEVDESAPGASAVASAPLLTRPAWGAQVFNIQGSSHRRWQIE